MTDTDLLELPTCVAQALRLAQDFAGECPPEDATHRAQQLLAMPDESLFEAAQLASKRWADAHFNFCSIVNAKSGRCSQDCAWCAQSRKFQTASPEYALLDADTVLAHARAVQQAGVRRFSLVTSGRKLSAREVREACTIVRRIRAETGLEVCMSAGLLTRDELQSLFAAGVCRYHCNLESSRAHFAKLCSTHTTDDKIATLRAARSVGMDVCSGGIIGMGESERDRLDLALELRALAMGSIPINILHPIAGTPLETTPLLSEREILRTVALFRLTNPRAQLRFAGGRARLSHEVQVRAMRIGINSAITGDLLTTSGSAIEADRALVREAGLIDERESVIDFDHAHLWHPYAGTVRAPQLHHVVGAHGVRLTLADGRELIDGTSSWWCALFGYARPEIISAVHKQVDTLAHVMFGGITHDAAAALGRKLLQVVPRGLTRIFYCDSGSVSIEIAMKMAVQYQQALGYSDRRTFVTLRHGYHGDTRNAMSVCDPDTGMHQLFADDRLSRVYLDSPTSRFGGSWDEHDLDALRALFEERSDRIAAFILEPIVQAAGAMRFYHPQFLRGARELCSQYGVLLICDEIATGFGRTGRAFACDWTGITPDVMTIGKGLTGGFMSLAATLSTAQVADTISAHPPYALMHGPTFMANPIACAAAGAALDIFSTFDYQSAAARIQTHMLKALAHFAQRDDVVDVRACGAIAVVEVVPQKAADLRRLQEAFVQAGVWVRPFGTLFYLMPPLVISNEELDALLVGFGNVLERWLDGSL